MLFKVEKKEVAERHDRLHIKETWQRKQNSSEWQNKDKEGWLS